MNRVHTYPLWSLDWWCDIDMPQGAEPLCVQVQDGVPCLWARVDPTAPLATYRFRIAGTGQDLDAKVGKYIGTFHGGKLVFHVFAEAT